MDIYGKYPYSTIAVTFYFKYLNTGFPEVQGNYINFLTSLDNAIPF